MADDTARIIQLLQRVQLGTGDDQFDALMELSILCKPFIEDVLKDRIRRELLPIVTGQVNVGLQGACFAAIALAKMGDHSQDVAAPLVTALQYYAEDPEKFSGPMDEYMNSSNLLCFTVHVTYALSLFKGDVEVIGSLIDVIALCLDPESGEDRIKSQTGEGGPQFYDNRIRNLVSACLRSIGAIGDSGTDDGAKMLEWWSTRGNTTAKIALELFGRSWEEIVNRETKSENGEIEDLKEQEREEDEQNNEKVSKQLAKVLNLCESDPDAGLELIGLSTKGDPKAESNPLWRWAKAIAYGSKGLLQALRRAQIDDEGLIRVSTWDGQEFRQNLHLTEAQLNYLEAALREVHEVEMIDPDFVKKIGTEEEPVGEAKVDLMATALERCRLGRVQELMGLTKLRYFGAEHRRMGVRPGFELTREDYDIFLDSKFSTSLIARAAIAMDKGRDGKGRKFITFLLYQKPLNEWGPDETLGNALSAGAIYFFNDGSWHHSDKTDRVFLGAASQGMSLPREFRETPDAERETPQPAHTDSRQEQSKGTTIERAEPELRKEPKEGSFFKKLFG